MESPMIKFNKSGEDSPKSYVTYDKRVDTPIATPPSTPTPTTAQAHELHREIHGIYQQLASLNCLAPCELVNTMLTRLVTLCIEPYGLETIEHFNQVDGVQNLCQNLQVLCATAEGELERYWVQKILNGVVGEERSSTALTQTLLESFPYHSNYLDLSHIEASLLRPFLSSPPSNIAFIGSGPLPLSSLCLLSHFPSITIHNVDRDSDALELSSSLTSRLGLEKRMSFSCEDATDASSDLTNWAKFDVVFLAALVGMQSVDKIEVLRGLHKRLMAGSLVVCRSARGLRGVLYPILELSDELQSAGFEILAEMHPWNSVVNSVVLLRAK